MGDGRTAEQAFEDVLDRRREALSAGTFRSIDEMKAERREDLGPGRFEIAVERVVYVSSALEKLANVAGIGDDAYFRQLLEMEELSFAYEYLGRLVTGLAVFSDRQRVVMDKLGELFAVEKEANDWEKARGLVVEIGVLCSMDDLASGSVREATSSEEIDRVVAEAVEKRRLRLAAGSDQ